MSIGQRQSAYGRPGICQEHVDHLSMGVGPWFARVVVGLEAVSLSATRVMRT